MNKSNFTHVSDFRGQNSLGNKRSRLCIWIFWSLYVIRSKFRGTQNITSWYFVNDKILYKSTIKWVKC